MNQLIGTRLYGLLAMGLLLCTTLLCETAHAARALLRSSPTARSFEGQVVSLETGQSN